MNRCSSRNWLRMEFQPDLQYFPKWVYLAPTCPVKRLVQANKICTRCTRKSTTERTNKRWITMVSKCAPKRKHAQRKVMNVERSTTPKRSDHKSSSFSLKRYLPLQTLRIRSFPSSEGQSLSIARASTGSFNVAFQFRNFDIYGIILLNTTLYFLVCPDKRQKTSI